MMSTFTIAAILLCIVAVSGRRSDDARDLLMPVRHPNLDRSLDIDFQGPTCSRRLSLGRKVVRVEFVNETATGASDVIQFSCHSTKKIFDGCRHLLNQIVQIEVGGRFRRTVTSKAFIAGSEMHVIRKSSKSSNFVAIDRFGGDFGEADRFCVGNFRMTRSHRVRKLAKFGARKPLMMKTRVVRICEVVGDLSNNFLIFFPQPIVQCTDYVQA